MSLPSTRNGEGKTALARQIGERMAPSELYGMYNPELQGILDGRCKSVALLSCRPDVPTLKDIADAYDTDDAAVEWIKIQLERINMFVNVKEKLDLDQLYEVSVQILNCYDNLNVLEFALFCGRLRHGRYESFYGSVDPMKILVSLDKFMEDKRRDWWKYVEEKEKQDKSEAERSSVGVPLKELLAKNPGSFPNLERFAGVRPFREDEKDVSPPPLELSSP